MGSVKRDSTREGGRREGGNGRLQKDGLRKEREKGTTIDGIEME